MSADIIGIPMEHLIPAGVLGPEAVRLDVRAYLVPHGSGLVLVDTGMDATGQALDLALAQAGAAWSDVSHVLITHGHPDHTRAVGLWATCARSPPVPRSWRHARSHPRPPEPDRRGPRDPAGRRLPGRRGRSARPGS